MRRRIRCPFHQENTPSLVQKRTNWYCYGACNRAYSNSEVESKTGEHYEYEEGLDEREDIGETFKYIHSLPSKEIRGLSLPADERGYFICWPGDAYYKYRLFKPTGSKYIGPKGRGFPPLFWARKKGSRTLWITEGEINCMSVAQAFPEHDHCSPGSASNFNADNLAKHLTEFQGYDNVRVILDKDAAGTKGLIGAKAFFLYKIPFISFLQLDPDANEILVTHGKGKLREALFGSNYQ